VARIPVFCLQPTQPNLLSVAGIENNLIFRVENAAMTAVSPAASQRSTLR
jgi:hypothetical protein